MPNKDLISKQLLRQLIVDFGNQLFGLNIIEAELLSSEQARVEDRRADLVARVKNREGKSYILHVELQNDNQKHMPLRMMRYYTDLALEHEGEEIEQHLLYIGKAPLTMSDHVRAREWRYCYKIMDMRQLDSEHFLRSGNPDALVLAILCDIGDEPEPVVAHIVEELRRLHGDQLDSLRNSLLKLENLARNRNLQNSVKEKSKMIVNIEELATYQEGLERGQVQGREEGREQGREQGQEQERQEIVLRLLDKFLPEQVAELSGVPIEKIKAIQGEGKS